MVLYVGGIEYALRRPKTSVCCRSAVFRATARSRGWRSLIYRRRTASHDALCRYLIGRDPELGLSRYRRGDDAARLRPAPAVDDLTFLSKDRALGTSVVKQRFPDFRIGSRRADRRADGPRKRRHCRRLRNRGARLVGALVASRAASAALADAAFTGTLMLAAIFITFAVRVISTADVRTYFAPRSPPNCAPHKSCCAKAGFEALIQNKS